MQLTHESQQLTTPKENGWCGPLPRLVASLSSLVLPLPRTESYEFAGCAVNNRFDPRQGAFRDLPSSPPIPLAVSLPLNNPPANFRSSAASMPPSPVRRPAVPPRQPFTSRTNALEGFPSPHPSSTPSKRRLAPSATLPPPSYAREHGIFLGRRRPKDCEGVGQFVKRVHWEGKVMVVKYGRSVRQAEVDVMKMVRERTHVPVPEVFGTAFDEAAGELFIYQEFIEGTTLTAAWPTLSHPDLSRIKSDFSRYVHELGALALPPDASLGSCDASSSYRLSEPCHAVFAQKPEPKVQSVEDFTRWIRFEISRRSRDLANSRKDFDLERLFRDGDVGLVHADLHGENILVKNGRIAAILDWELAAWMPPLVEALSLVEYSRMFDEDAGAPIDALIDALGLEDATRDVLDGLCTALRAWPDEKWEEVS
ncbi:hypothetical protein RTG_02582 [Rhodotorula toruloides ATCC 204091]|uniref:Protein kinase-like domain-containing protein n=1 Tax=Rhodotorula toruloides TaxID=5286 RepID=A0A0K3CPN3_RHOTO|nr:hypothetical protein RTG_02582 [Rhodotorula toruloides ATCC 204091]PRQ71010.1 Protein kinase-like domain-containing protein [Rhodotorula toruloides]